MKIDKDLSASPIAFALHWGLPILALFVVIGVPHPLKTWVWVAAFAWMGVACLLNARRCGRKHCYWTGPFFLFLTLPVLAHGYGWMPLGDEGWKILGLTFGLGGWLIMVVTERNGKYY